MASSNPSVFPNDSTIVLVDLPSWNSSPVTRPRTPTLPSSTLTCWVAILFCNGPTRPSKISRNFAKRQVLDLEMVRIFQDGNASWIWAMVTVKRKRCKIYDSYYTSSLRPISMNTSSQCVWCAGRLDNIIHTDHTHEVLISQHS